MGKKATPASHRNDTGQGSGRLGFWVLLAVFLRLGLTSFGGPVAHLGYFRHEFVQRRRWLSESAYADLVALYDPVWLKGIHGSWDLLLGLAAFGMLQYWKVPSWVVVAVCAGAGMVLGGTTQ